MTRTRTAKSVIMVALVACVIGCPSVGPPGPPGPPGSEVAVAPGLNVVITEVVIPDDRRPEITYSPTDDRGVPVALNQFANDRAIRFVLAYLAGSGVTKSNPVGQFVSYVTSSSGAATYDPPSLSQHTENGDGTITYKFATALPEGYDRSATHQVGAQFQRTNPVDGVVYPANAVYTFRPDGGTVTQRRQITTTETCNKCHTRLSAHGVRREIQYCILCHQPQTAGVNFPEMIHKIHMGENLPSVQAGTPYVIGQNDFSDVVFPQDIRRCVACHTEEETNAGPVAPNADVWKNGPSMAGCGSCHDRTWFGNPNATPDGYTNHFITQVDDSNCGVCHKANEGIPPVLKSIVDAHTLPTETAQAPGLALSILALNATAEGALTIRVKAVDKNGQPYTNLNALDRLRAQVGYPATDYQVRVQEDLLKPPAGAALVNNGDGSFDYTFSQLLPAGSTDTFAVGLEGRIAFLDDQGATLEQGPATNGLTYFVLAGNPNPPVPRRTVVDGNQCNQCHYDLRGHGGMRVGVDYCVMCHNTSATDIGQRNNSDAQHLKANAVTINFKDMIHRVHTGENLSNPYTVIGFGGSVHDFTKVAFPGLRQECSICHGSNQMSLPLPPEALSTIVDNGITVTEVLPERAACTSCHDAEDANYHAIAQSNLQQGIETCSVCHGDDAAFAVQLVHKIGP